MIKVMSFNTRTPVSADGINFFEYRKGRILEILRREKPDLVGFQEIMDSGRDWLCQALGNEYMVVGSGRGANLTGEGSFVAIRCEAFFLVEMKQFWLSDTPDVPGSVYANCGQSKHPRIAVAIKVMHRESGRILHFVNTHTDHVGAKAREKGLLLIADYLKARQGDMIVTGDMNAQPDSAEIIGFLDAVQPMGIVDCTAKVGDTFHGFGKYGTKIDYVFTNMRVAESYAVEDVPVDGVYYSDHRAVCALIEV